MILAWRRRKSVTTLFALPFCQGVKRSSLLLGVVSALQWVAWHRGVGEASPRRSQIHSLGFVPSSHLWGAELTVPSSGVACLCLCARVCECVRLCVLGVSALVHPDPRHLVQITLSALGLKTGAKSVSHLFSSLPLRAEVDAPVHWRGMGAPSWGQRRGEGSKRLTGVSSHCCHRRLPAHEDAGGDLLRSAWKCSLPLYLLICLPSTINQSLLHQIGRKGEALGLSKIQTPSPC